MVNQKPALVTVMGNLLGEHRETTTYLVTHTPHSAGCLHLKPLDLITIGEVSQILCQGYKVKKKLHIFYSYGPFFKKSTSAAPFWKALGYLMKLCTS